MAENHEIDELSGRNTTGHVWDGIRELDTPLPRWWLYLFYACIAVAVVYWVLMPSWPTLNGYTKGALGFSDRRNVVREVSALQAARAPQFAKLSKANYAQVMADPQLAEFARAAGESVFGDNCRTCHGAGGAGAPGYPNLADDVWLWGGTLDDIEHTIRVGVRSTNPETRMSLMPAFGRDGILQPKDVSDVTEYVLSLGPIKERAKPDMAAAARGAAIYATQCVACHGEDAKGNRAFGAPSLVDDVWLYGGTREEVRRQIQEGRNGVMPTWASRFDAATIRALAVYVYSLGGGESAPAPSTEAQPATIPAAATAPASKATPHTP